MFKVYKDISYKTVRNGIRKYKNVIHEYVAVNLFNFKINKYCICNLVYISVTDL